MTQRDRPLSRYLSIPRSHAMSAGTVSCCASFFFALSCTRCVPYVVPPLALLCLCCCRALCLDVVLPLCVASNDTVRRMSIAVLCNQMGPRSDANIRPDVHAFAALLLRSLSLEPAPAEPGEVPYSSCQRLNAQTHAVAHTHALVCTHITPAATCGWRGVLRLWFLLCQSNVCALPIAASSVVWLYSGI